MSTRDPDYAHHDFGALEGGQVPAFDVLAADAPLADDAVLVRLPPPPSLSERIRARPGVAFAVAFGAGWVLAKAVNVALRTRR